MEQMSKELINRIEKALDITFKEWQYKYLLNEPMVLDMRMTGRGTGKTLVFVIKKLFEHPAPLLFRNKPEVLGASDWWCCKNRISKAQYSPYLDWYRNELKKVYEKLNKAGIVTREVVFKDL